MVSLRRLPLLFALCATSALSHADITADLGLTSEFVRDGISQTGGNVTWQAGTTVTHSSGIYAGIWGSGIDHRNNDELHSEWDGYGGFNLPLYRKWSLDSSLTRFTFYGDTERKGDNYNEGALRILWNNNFMAGYRVGKNYYGSDFNLHSLETAYTFQTKTFSIELYGANHRLDGTNEGTNFGGSESADDYWHFRVGVARSYNHWDYRINIERTNLGKDFDGGTVMQFSLHRYFRIW